MKQEEMDKAIAEHVGARFFTEDGGAFWHFVTSDRREFGRPTEDLNAMHEAEMFLVNSDDGKDAGCARYLYSRALYGVVVPVSQQPVMATARQRAEAFLRTIGKWRDE